MPGKKGANGDRDRDIWRDKVAGWSHADLAEKYGLTESRISQIITRVRGTLPRQTADDYRKDFAEQIDRLRKEMQAIVDAGPAPAFSSRGDQLFARADDEDRGPGVPVSDHAARLEATSRIIALQARAAKLLGLDSAEKAEIDTTVRYVIDGGHADGV